MRFIYSTVLVSILSAQLVAGQSTAQLVYDIFQTSCTFSSCHSNSNQAFGLDLEGSGGDALMDVYNNIVNATPGNSHAASNNNKLIRPGDPARSFLFRKIQNGLDPTLSLHPNENNPMPLGGVPLEDTQIELIRQWILYGAPLNEEVVDVSLIDEYYNNNGISSIPDPPAPPDPSEGFQLHLGPYFIAPGTENEVFLKHDLFLQENIEVVGTETFMGAQSHHFIINKFLSAGSTICGIPIGNQGPDNYADGYRNVNQSSHYASLLQLGAQAPGEFLLPYNTAYFWEAGTVLDLNSHYINASQNQVLAAEVYVNIYTQPSGMAKQEMNTLMLPENNLNIPGDGQEVVISQNIPIGLCYPEGFYIWSLTSHTHQHGTDFDIYKSDLFENEIDHLFDASCFIDGVPGCMDEFYDYQHPPTRVFDDYYRFKSTDWLKQVAKYENNSGQDVGFGLTSEDEMLITFMFFVQDTAGLSSPPTGLYDQVYEVAEAYPNPSGGKVMINAAFNGIDEVSLYNMNGRLIKNVSYSNYAGRLEIDLLDTGNRPESGLYWIMIKADDGRIAMSKVMYQSE